MSQVKRARSLRSRPRSRNYYGSPVSMVDEKSSDHTDNESLGESTTSRNISDRSRNTRKTKSENLSPQRKQRRRAIIGKAQPFELCETDPVLENAKEVGHSSRSSPGSSKNSTSDHLSTESPSPRRKEAEHHFKMSLRSRSYTPSLESCSPARLTSKEPFSIPKNKSPRSTLSSPPERKDVTTGLAMSLRSKSSTPSTESRSPSTQRATQVKSGHKNSNLSYHSPAGISKLTDTKTPGLDLVVRTLRSRIVRKSQDSQSIKKSAAFVAEISATQEKKEDVNSPESSDEDGTYSKQIASGTENVVVPETADNDHDVSTVSAKLRRSGSPASKSENTLGTKEMIPDVIVIDDEDEGYALSVGTSSVGQRSGSPDDNAANKSETAKHKPDSGSGSDSTVEFVSKGTSKMEIKDVGAEEIKDSGSGSDSTVEFVSKGTSKMEIKDVGAEEIKVDSEDSRETIPNNDDEEQTPRFSREPDANLLGQKNSSEDSKSDDSVSTVEFVSKDMSKMEINDNSGPEIKVECEDSSSTDTILNTDETQTECFTTENVASLLSRTNSSEELTEENPANDSDSSCEEVVLTSSVAGKSTPTDLSEPTASGNLTEENPANDSDSSCEEVVQASSVAAKSTPTDLIEPTASGSKSAGMEKSPIPIVQDEDTPDKAPDIPPVIPSSVSIPSPSHTLADKNSNGDSLGEKTPVDHSANKISPDTSPVKSQQNQNSTPLKKRLIQEFSPKNDAPIETPPVDTEAASNCTQTPKEIEKTPDGSASGKAEGVSSTEEILEVKTELKELSPMKSPSRDEMILEQSSTPSSSVDTGTSENKKVNSPSVEISQVCNATFIIGNTMELDNEESLSVVVCEDSTSNIEPVKLQISEESEQLTMSVAGEFISSTDRNDGLETQCGVDETLLSSKIVGDSEEEMEIDVSNTNNEDIAAEGPITSNSSSTNRNDPPAQSTNDGPSFQQLDTPRIESQTKNIDDSSDISSSDNLVIVEVPSSYKESSDAICTSKRTISVCPNSANKRSAKHSGRATRSAASLKLRNESASESSEYSDQYLKFVTARNSLPNICTTKLATRDEEASSSSDELYSTEENSVKTTKSLSRSSSEPAVVCDEVNKEAASQSTLDHISISAKASEILDDVILEICKDQEVSENKSASAHQLESRQEESCYAVDNERTRPTCSSVIASSHLTTLATDAITSSPHTSTARKSFFNTTSSPTSGDAAPPSSSCPQSSPGLSHESLQPKADESSNNSTSEVIIPETPTQTSARTRFLPKTFLESLNTSRKSSRDEQAERSDGSGTERADIIETYLSESCAIAHKAPDVSDQDSDKRAGNSTTEIINAEESRSPAMKLDMKNESTNIQVVKSGPSPSRSSLLCADSAEMPVSTRSSTPKIPSVNQSSSAVSFPVLKKDLEESVTSERKSRSSSVQETSESSGTSDDGSSQSDSPIGRSPMAEESRSPAMKSDMKNESTNIQVVKSGPSSSRSSLPCADSAEMPVSTRSSTPKISSVNQSSTAVSIPVLKQHLEESVTSERKSRSSSVQETSESSGTSDDSSSQSDSPIGESPVLQSPVTAESLVCEDSASSPECTNEMESRSSFTHADETSQDLFDLLQTSDSIVSTVIEDSTSADVTASSSVFVSSRMSDSTDDDSLCDDSETDINSTGSVMGTEPFDGSMNKVPAIKSTWTVVDNTPPPPPLLKPAHSLETIKSTPVDVAKSTGIWTVTKKFSPGFQNYDSSSSSEDDTDIFQEMFSADPRPSTSTRKYDQAVLDVGDKNARKGTGNVVCKPESERPFTPSIFAESSSDDSTSCEEWENEFLKQIRQPKLLFEIPEHKNQEKSSVSSLSEDSSDSEINLEDESESEEEPVIDLLKPSGCQSKGGDLFVIDNVGGHQSNRGNRRRKVEPVEDNMETARGKQTTRKAKLTEDKNKTDRRRQTKRKVEAAEDQTDRRKRTKINAPLAEGDERRAIKPQTGISDTIRKAIERRLRRQTLRSLLLTGRFGDKTKSNLIESVGDLVGVKWIDSTIGVRVTVRSAESAQRLCQSLNGQLYNDQPVQAELMTPGADPPSDTLILTFPRLVEEFHVTRTLPQATCINALPENRSFSVKFDSTFESVQAKIALEQRRIDGCLPRVTFLQSEEIH